jgi:hypothetical protein
MVKKAFMLMIHKNPYQVNYLLNQLLEDGSSDIYIHINKLNRNIEEKLLKHKNIYILEDCVDVYWGDIGLTKAMLILLNAVLKSGKYYDFVSFKTGQDLVISNGLNKHLLNNSNKIFMDARQVPKNDYTYAHIAIKWPKFAKRLYDGFQVARLLRTSLIHLNKIGINFSPNPYKLPNNFNLYWGRTWFTIPFNVAKYIVDFVDDNPWYFRIFENALVPDELFFQTIIMNSPYSEEVLNDNLTYENKIINNHPSIFTEVDIIKIEKSGKYFARKFDLSVDQKVIQFYVNKIKVDKTSYS